jgi:hypothetical protein
MPTATTRRVSPLCVLAAKRRKGRGPALVSLVSGVSALMDPPDLLPAGSVLSSGRPRCRVGPQAPGGRWAAPSK